MSRIDPTRKTAVLATICDVSHSLGEAVSALSVCRALQNDMGYDVTLVAPRPRNADMLFETGGRPPRWTRNLTRWRLPNSLNVLAQLPSFVLNVGRARRGLVYVRYSPMSVLQVMVGRLFGARVVLEHNAWQADERAAGGRYPFLASVEGFLQGLAGRLSHRNRVVIQDNFDKLRLAGVPAERIVLAPNATNVDMIAPVPRDKALRVFDLPTDRRYIGFIGTFAHWQGIDILVAALPAIRAVRPDVHLLLAGQGPERERAERLAGELGVANHVTFLGVVPYRNVASMLGCLDVALLPTSPCFYTTAGRSPMKLYDYAAAGRPIIVADLPSLDEWRREGWFVTYAPGDTDELATKTLDLLASEDRRRAMAERARSVAVERFSWASRLSKLLEGLDG